MTGKTKAKQDGAVDQSDLSVPIEEIPLPPEDIMAEELGETQKPETPAETVKPDVAVLDFVEDTGVSVNLKRPFRFAGKPVKKIFIRPLITQELTDLVSGDATYERYDAYAIMTGFPATVLRGLDADDGMEVNAKCYDFLPQILRSDRAE